MSENVKQNFSTLNGKFLSQFDILIFLNFNFTRQRRTQLNGSSKWRETSFRYEEIRNVLIDRISKWKTWNFLFIE